MKLTMQKMLPFLLMLALVLAFAPLQARADYFTLFDDQSGQWGTDLGQKVASTGDTLYIARSEGLYAYHIGDAAPKQLMDFTKTDLSGAPLKQDMANPGILALFCQNDVRYALEYELSGLWRFDPGTSALGGCI